MMVSDSRLWRAVLLLVLCCCWSTVETFHESPIPDCPRNEGWTCKWGSEHWEATSNETALENVTVTYTEVKVPNDDRPQKRVSIICTGNRHDGLVFPKGFLRNFDFGFTTYFRILQCPQTSHSLSDILEGHTVNMLRFMAADPLGDSLNPALFRNLDYLTHLNLMGNGITSLPKNLFDYVPHLETVNLKENQLTQLPSNTFAAIPNIVNLELGYNNLTELTERMEGLDHLQTLNVYHNHIRKISANFFSSVPSLRSVDLQGNQLTTLPHNVFQNLTHIRMLKLFTNKLTELPTGLLHPLKRLEEFDISDNPQLTYLPSDLLQNLTTTNLTMVNLRRCGLKNMSTEFFKQCKSLKKLYLDWNNLNELVPGTFVGLKNLEFLDLSRNRLTTIPGGVFDVLPSLTLLKLNRNTIKWISSSAFYNLVRLRQLDLSRNNLTTIPDDVFKPTVNLEDLNLSYNSISNTDRGPTIFMLPHSVRILSLQHNLLRGLPSAWFYANTLLSHLDLSNNLLNHFNSNDCQPTSDNITIDLKENNITSIFIDLNLARYLAKNNPPRPQKPVVLLGKNPFICDCNAKYLLEYTNSDQHQFLFTVDAGDLECWSPPSLAGRPATSLQMAELICDILKNCSAPCRCRQYAVGDIVEMDCRKKNMTQLPITAPNNVSVLRMDDNKMAVIDRMGNPRWENLTELHLSHNLIWAFEQRYFPSNLRLLDLQYNQLERIEDVTLDALDKLTKLEMWLGDNPWKCNCGAKRFKEFLNFNVRRVGNLSSIRCNGTHKGAPVYTANICPLQMISSKEIIIGATVISLLLAIGLATIGIGYYRFRREVKVWLYAHHWCLWFVTENEIDREKTYDAFISFSQEDSEFVASHLLPGLESSDSQQPSYKVCIHYRDWLAGEWIPDQIIRSVQDSRRTIVVLSKNFIRSVWGRLEFKAAHHQALQDRTNRIIMVVLGDLPPSSEMDAELKMYVKFNTYLKWEDPWFWQKLRYAMPHNPLSKPPSWSASTSITCVPSSISDQPRIPLSMLSCPVPSNISEDKMELVRT